VLVDSVRWSWPKKALLNVDMIQALKIAERELHRVGGFSALEV